MSIKPPSIGNSSPAQSTPTTSTPTATSTEVPVNVVNPEAVAKALKDYQKIRDKLKQPNLSGAAGLFTENVVFPAELLDPNNPANDPKFLHLLLALFGLKEMKQFFQTEEQMVEEDTEESDEQSDDSSDDDSDDQSA